MVLFCGASSLTRRLVCLLYMLLALVSAVFFGPESLGARDLILLSHIWGFPFRCLLRLAGWRWRYSTPHPHGTNPKVKVKVTLRLMGLMTRYLLLIDSYSLDFVGRPLSREDGSVFCICCWSLPAQSFSGPSPLGSVTIFYCLKFETSLFVGRVLII
jgi:hypothetical protein